MNCEPYGTRGGHCGPQMDCGCSHKARRFFTREECVEMLENYRDELEKELKALDQKLAEVKE